MCLVVRYATKLTICNVYLCFLAGLSAELSSRCAAVQEFPKLVQDPKAGRWGVSESFPGFVFFWPFLAHK